MYLVRGVKFALVSPAIRPASILSVPLQCRLRTLGPLSRPVCSLRLGEEDEGTADFDVVTPTRVWRDVGQAVHLWPEL